MVLWEITLATAYVLGLRRTYRLALRGQRRLLGNKYPKIREFTERRTRIIFNMALHVYKEIQHRDITVGRNVGNWLLRWLDRARPQANIRGDSGQVCHPGKGSAPARLEGKGTKGSEAKCSQGGGQDSMRTKRLVSSRYTSHMRGSNGNTIRSRFTDNVRPKMRSLPVLASALWWQPVRRHYTELASLSSSSVCHRSSSTLLPLQRLPVVHVLQSGPGQRQRSLFREDIARLMRTT